MISKIVIIGKKNQSTYVVKAEDWLNPDMYVIDGYDPYSTDTNPILKHEYKIGWVIDENGDVNYSF